MKPTEYLTITERPNTSITVMSDSRGPLIVASDGPGARAVRYTPDGSPKFALAILEAHQIGYVYADIHGLRKQGCTGCGFRIEGQVSEIGNMREIHRAHVSEVLEKHMQEREAEAVRASARYIERLYTLNGPINKADVLADLEIAADRLSRGLHAN